MIIVLYLGQIKNLYAQPHKFRKTETPYIKISSQLPLNFVKSDKKHHLKLFLV
jgi:hypothetical protein